MKFITALFVLLLTACNTLPQKEHDLTTQAKASIENASWTPATANIREDEKIRYRADYRILNFSSENTLYTTSLHIIGKDGRILQTHDPMPVLTRAEGQIALEVDLEKLNKQFDRPLDSRFMVYMSVWQFSIDDVKREIFRGPPREYTLLFTR